MRLEKYLTPPSGATVFQLRPYQLEALEAIAEERGESIAALVRDAVRTFLKRRGR